MFGRYRESRRRWVLWRRTHWALEPGFVETNPTGRARTCGNEPNGEGPDLWKRTQRGEPGPVETNPIRRGDRGWQKQTQPRGGQACENEPNRGAAIRPCGQTSRIPSPRARTPPA